MDIFSTTVTAGGIIAKFLSSCAAYSDEAKALKAQFDWDMRALQTIIDHFETRRSQSHNQELSSHDQDLVERTAKYLEDLLDNAHTSIGKIRRKGWLRDVITRTTWIARRSELKEMEQELYSWTQRFGVRVLGLPQEFNPIIPSTANTNTPITVHSNKRLHEFLQLTSQMKASRAEEMFLQDSTELEIEISNWRDNSFLPFQTGGKQFIMASRKVSTSTLSRPTDFESLKLRMGQLAAALNCLDVSSDIRLLKVEYYLYHSRSMQFLFAHASPYSITSMINLEDLIQMDPLPSATASLNKRLKIAYQLAEAVFYLHVAGFLHKNITSSSVVALRRRGQSRTGNSMLDNMFLMGFDLIRSTDADTTKEGAIKESEQLSASIQSSNAFQHPERLLGQESKPYTKQYDVYSLGVVLLELGLWQLISTSLPDLRPEGWQGKTRDMEELALASLGSAVGEKYQRVVLWCLSLDGNMTFKEEDFVEFVLSPLGSLADTLS